MLRSTRIAVKHLLNATGGELPIKQLRLFAIQ
jgi:hypothetical protein